MQRRFSTLIALACAHLGCRQTRQASSLGDAAAVVSTSRSAPASTVSAIDLTESLQHGVIDSDGPVVDLGERQAITALRGVPPTGTEEVNGSSWARVGARLRLWIPIDPSRAADEPPTNPPTAIRLRIRRATARRMAVIIDGVLVRTTLLPQGTESSVLTLAVPPDRFRRSVAAVELRFSASRAVIQSGAPVALVDWVQLARGEGQPARCVDLVNDVSVERTPRRALTLYAPTELSVTVMVPARASLRLSLAAESPRGAPRPPAPVVARFRAEADGVPAIERSVSVTPNTAWQDLSLDLSPFEGRATRVAVRAEAPGNPDDAAPADVRLAVASPRIESTRARGALAPGRVRNVIMVVLRGARLDRFLPAVSARFRGGFATLAREGVRVEATAASARAWPALLSASTGLAADAHGLHELTDLLGDSAPTLGSVLAEHGVASSAFTDDALWIGSGADRGFSRRTGCPEGQPLCRVDAIFHAITEGITANAPPGVTLVVTRAGAVPLDPSNDLVLALDPETYEGTMTPAQTGVLASRVRHTDYRLDARDRARLDVLYDAALLAVDRGIASVIERLQAVRRDDSTLLIVVGDRGTALANGRYLGDGPMSRREVASTVILARGPGLPRGATLRGVASTLDAAATVLDALGVTQPPEFEGVSLYDSERYSERAVSFVAGSRDELGLRFGRWIALPRPPSLGGMSLFDPIEDPTGSDDLGDANPIARAFAETWIMRTRGDASRRTFARSTRVLPAPSR